MSKANKSNTDEIVKVSAADEQEALSPLAQLIQKGLYLDRTMQLKKLYDSTPSRYDFIIRPHGFGKSILADTLEALFTHDFDTLKGVAAQKSWQEPYRQVVRLDLSKISNIEKYYYPTLDLSNSKSKHNGLGIPRDWDLGIKQEQEQWQEQDKNSSQSKAQSNAFQDEDIYSFNSDLYTLLFNEITNNSSKEIPVANGLERDGSAEDFSTMLSVCSERSAMGQIKDLLARCHLNSSRLLIVENFDIPLLSSLHNPRLYNYRSRVLITFMNLLGYYKQIFRHVIFLGSINIDYRKGKEEYPPFMDYLPLSKEFSFTKVSSTLLGFTREDLTKAQFKPWLEKALAKIHKTCEDHNEIYLPTMEELLTLLEEQYGSYSFDKVHTVLNPSSVIGFLTTQDTDRLFKGYWFNKNVPNFNYIARIARISQEEMLTLMTIIFAGKLQLVPENVMLPVLINDQGLEESLDKEAAASAKSDKADKTDAFKDEQSNSANPMAMPDDMVDELVDVIENNSQELSDLEHSAFASDEGISELGATDDVAVELDENGQSVHKAISNEFESIAELRRANDDEFLAQGFPGIPFPILFYAMGYLTCCHIKNGEIFSSIVNSEVFFSLKHIIVSHYFKAPITNQLGKVFDDEDFFPYNEGKLHKLIAPLVNNMRLEHFRKPVSAKSIRALVMIWLQLKNATTHVEAMGLEEPFVHEIIAKQQAKAGLDTQVNGLADTEHVPVNELEQALFNAQEQKIKQHQALKEQPQSPSEIDTLSEENNQTTSSEELGGEAKVAVIIDESQETEPNQTEYPVPPRRVNPDEDKSYLLEVDEKTVIEAMERYYKKNTVVVEPNSNQNAQASANKQVTATKTEDRAELEVLDTLTDLLDSEDKALLEQQNQANEAGAGTEQDNKPSKVILPIDLLKPEDFVLSQADKDKRKRNRRLRLANSNVQVKAPKEGLTSSESGSALGPTDEVLAPGDKRGEIDYAKRASASMERISKKTGVVNKTIAELTGNAPEPNAIARAAAVAAATAAAKADAQKQEIKIHTSNQGRKVLGSNKVTGLAALLATQEQVDGLKNAINAQEQSQLALDKLNSFSNMTVVPKNKVSARLAGNIQDLKRSHAEQLWENLGKLSDSKDPVLQNSHSDMVNKHIIWDWTPYLDLNNQFAIIKEAEDSMQKAHELERIAFLATKNGDKKLASQCEELRSQIKASALIVADFADGKDLGSLLLEQMHYVVKYKHLMEANFILVSLLQYMKDQHLTHCFMEGAETLHKLNEGHFDNSKSKAEVLELINVETSEQRSMSFKKRAKNLLKISMAVIKDIALQKLAAEAAKAKDIDAAIFINKLILKVHDEVADQITSRPVDTLSKADEGDTDLPDFDVTLDLSEITPAGGFDGEGETDEDMEAQASYQLSNKPVAKPLNDGEQLLLQLNHVSLMADNAYNSMLLEDHCNLTLFNDRNALVFEFGVINGEDDETAVVSDTASKLAKIRHPLAAVIDRTALAEQATHTVSLSLVAKVNGDSCTLVDLRKVRDSKEAMANGDVQGLYNPYFYLNIQNHLNFLLLPKYFGVDPKKSSSTKARSKAKAKEKAKANTKPNAQAKATTKAQAKAITKAQTKAKAPAKAKDNTQASARAKPQSKAPVKDQVKSTVNKPKAKSAAITDNSAKPKGNSQAQVGEVKQERLSRSSKTSATNSSQQVIKAPKAKAKTKANTVEATAKSANKSKAGQTKAKANSKASADGNATAKAKSNSVVASKQTSAKSSARASTKASTSTRAKANSRANASASAKAAESDKSKARASSKAKTLSKSEQSK